MVVLRLFLRDTRGIFAILDSNCCPREGKGNTRVLFSVLDVDTLKAHGDCLEDKSGCVLAIEEVF